MANAAKIIERIRSFGANITLNGHRLEIVNPAKLPAGAADFVRQHGKEIAAFLAREGDAEERAAIMEYCGGLRRADAEYLTRLLLAAPPAGTAATDWSWFVGEATKIVANASGLRSAA